MLLVQSDVMVKISSCRNATPVTHIKTEPCPVEVTGNNVDPDKQHLYSCNGAKDLVSDNSSSELDQIKQEPGHSETDFMHPGSRNVQPQSTDSRVSTKTEPECAPVHLSFGVKTEPDIHDVVNFPLKEEEEEDVDIKLETAEEESGLRQDGEAGN